MVRKKKDLIPTATVNPLQGLLQDMAKDGTIVNTAADATAKWRYIDFRNVKLDIPILALEWLFGSRGLLGGRLLQLRATFSKGKSSFMYALYGMAQASKHTYAPGKVPVWALHIETEGAGSPPDYIASCGCDPAGIGMAEQASLQGCLGKIDEFVARVRGGFGGEKGETGRMCKTKFDNPYDKEMESPIMLGIDSLSSLGLEDQVAEDVADMTSTPGLASHSRIMRDWLRRRCHRLMTAQALLILTSHETAKIETGVKAFGGPKKSSLAQEAIGIHATYGADVNATRYVVKETGQVLGDVITLKTFKNKISPRERQLPMYLVWNQGFDWAKTEARFLLEDPNSPFNLNDEQIGTCSRQGGRSPGIVCPKLGPTVFKSDEEFVIALHANTELVRACREKLRIRGFGFDFETKYSNCEIEEADGVEGNAAEVPEPGDAERPEGRGPDSTPSA